MNVPLEQHRSRSLLLLCTLLLPLASGCKQKVDDVPENKVTVVAARPIEAPISEEIVADALLAPISAASISPRISAPIRAEYVQRGSHVRRGQLLISLDDRDLKGSALDSMGAVASAQANYTATNQTNIPEEVRRAELDAAQLKAALDVSSRAAAERQALYRQGALSGREADSASAAEVQASAAYETSRQHAALLLATTRVTEKQAAQGQLTSAQGRLENAQAQVSYANLRSPIAGVVSDRPFFPGETAAAGVPIITVMDTSSLLAKLHLAQASAQKLMLGDHAKVSVPGMEDPADATVTFIGPATDPGSTTIEVWLRLPNSKGRFKVGTPVHAVIETATIAKAMQLPIAALVPSDDGSTSVMVLTSEGIAKKHTVKVGVRTSDAVQILSGLTLEDTVVTEGAYGLDDGTQVTVRKPGSATEDKE